ncbi:mannose-6-phosphate isomerase type 1 [Dokdonia sp. Hel_I_63]|uniref:type I phosphomannose isomerase catalytic subunit n=1 Tax=unclassified Dokdonia TaxID=2615033 RepID=UPI00020A683B|nr:MULTISPECIES: type I phosphomannose isomerase catalytic subunit [unclassified Dokdonia]AEE19523.1 mannose-6-phosphate isomerase, class I [Dokdonia sp. 4H-3-7-5]TVZ21249.1 mannose-6-phosphate isomerase type 1 [Dokdonia sp. Hel_I_63]
MKLYPLFFTPHFKYRLWGGDKLRTELNKEFSGDQIGESWEVSDVEGSETQVSNGALAGNTLHDLITTYGAQFLGVSVLERFGTNFPLLIKFLDAKTPLSIQVHPDDKVAKERHNSFGKNEMWYIMQADHDASIIVGFEEDTSKEQYEESVKDGNIVDLLHTEYIKEGDIFHIPTGRVHAIGAGVLLAEIQQTSDVTYRIFDYNRIDAKTGAVRDLHSEEAIDVVDLKGYDTYNTPYKTEVNTAVSIMETPYFQTTLLALEGEATRDYSNKDSFTILMCVDGSATFSCDDEVYAFKKGQTVVLPAVVNELSFASSHAKILEVTV